MTKKSQSQGQSNDFDHMLTSVKSKMKKVVKYYETYSETIEEMENFDIKYVIFREELDLL